MKFIHEVCGEIAKRKIIYSAIAIAIIFCTYFLTIYYFDHQFTILYSLDKRQNDQAIIDVIDNSNHYIYFAIYTFTKSNIADALVQAKKRGVDVWGITDLVQSTSSSEAIILDKLRTAGINVETQKHTDGIMHIKGIVTDTEYAIGSYNWTESATVNNDEILEIGSNKYLHDQYFNIIKKVLEINQSTSTKNISDVVTSNQTADKTKIYDYTQAPEHVGEKVTITGNVLKTYASKKGATFIEFCSNTKNCPFSAIIFNSDIQKFGDLSGLKNNRIKLTGTLENYKGQTEMILSDPDQIISEN